MNLIKEISLLLFVIFFLTFSTKAQTHTPKTVNINSKCGGYYEFLPAGYTVNTSQKYPIIFYLHGGASYGNGTSSAMALLLQNEGIPRLINLNSWPASFTVNGFTTSFIVISPQFKSAPTPLEVNQVIDYIINQNYRIETSRIYLTGYSVGGDAAWKTPRNSTSSSRLAALVPVAGYNNPYSDTTAKFIAGSNLPVWAIHSSSDASISVNVSVDMVNKINSFNPTPAAFLTRLSNVTHNNTVTTAYDIAFRPNGKNIYEWFLQYSRNYEPVSNAGNDTTIILPNSYAILDGRKSTDPEGLPLTFIWSKLSGPSQFVINNPTSSVTNVSNLISGEYVFQLKVTDNGGISDTSIKKISVINPNPNIMPKANAGNDTTIFYPSNINFLDATNSYDSDGAIESVLWTQISGPTVSSIVNPSSLNSNVKSLKPGIYFYELKIIDNDKAENKDTVMVTVINQFPNISPTANAGADQTITLPINSASLNGNGSADTDGKIISFQWRQLNGPGIIILPSPNSSITVAGNLLKSGRYQFELKVTDDSLAVSNDTITIRVNPEILQKSIKVNLYAGNYPAGAGWNNWNFNNPTSNTFLYTDGVASTVTANITSSSFGDNGTNYPATMCPPEVGRTASYSNSTRTLILSGLDINKKYDFEAYASRLSYSTISTKFTIGNNTITIFTDRNYSNKALFTDLTPTNDGKITVNIASGSTFNYLNGFSLTEYSNGSQTTNKPPVSIPGNAQAITLPVNQVTLNGNSSYDEDGTISSFNWSQISGPTNSSVTSPTTSSTTVTGLNEGIYQFQLAVTDNLGLISVNTIQISVLNPQVFQFLPPPVTDSINCGKVIKVVVLGSSTAWGNGVTIYDSSWVAKFEKYLKGKNPLNNLINLAANSLTTYHVLCPTGFIPPIDRPSPDDLHNITKALSYNPDVIIINLPLDDATNQYSLQETKDNYERTMALTNARNILVWVASPQPINYTWVVPTQLALRDWTFERFGSKAIDFWTTIAKADGTIEPIYNKEGDIWHLNNNGHHVLYTRVVGERILDTMCLRINMSPISNAGNDSTIYLPKDFIQLDGSASYDPDGTTLNYNWKKISGPSSYILTNSNQAKPLVNSLTYGDYQFELLVQDNEGLTSKDTIKVFVRSSVPIPPVAIINSDIIITLPVDSVKLFADKSYDVDGIIDIYNWIKISGPDQYLIQTNQLINPTIKQMINGVYLFELTVIDNTGSSSKDTVSITVNKALNKFPVANAGIDIILPYPVNLSQLNGSLSYDPDGTINSYKWQLIGGPISSYTINDNTLVDPIISNLSPGTYILELTVTDNEGAQSNDSIAIIVSPPPNQIPIAKAGADIEIRLPINTVQLNANQSLDNDGSVISYSWTKVSGPDIYKFNNSQIINPVLSDLGKGNYSIQLIVTDNSQAIAKDTINISVLNALNVPPVAKAGTDQSITLPVNSILLNGNGSTDIDGSITNYQWRQINGPSTLFITNQNQVIASAENPIAGTYQFELQVKDDSTAIGLDSVLVLVNPPLPLITQKSIKVNIGGGSPAGSGWNNWILPNLTLGTIFYSDETTSSIKTTLSAGSYADNGNNYPTTMCPVAVGKTTSYSTSTRTLTISGLDVTKKYDFEAYASRLSYSTIGTTFTIGTTSIAILTDRNYSNKAIFRNLIPSSNGQIVISISSTVNYNYINGFTLTEYITSNNRSPILLKQISTTDSDSRFDLKKDIFNAYPNPFQNSIELYLNNNERGNLKIWLTDVYGKKLKQIDGIKNENSFRKNIILENIPTGIYFLHIQLNGKIQTKKLIKTSN